MKSILQLLCVLLLGAGKLAYANTCLDLVISVRQQGTNLVYRVNGGSEWNWAGLEKGLGQVLPAMRDKGILDFWVYIELADDKIPTSGLVEPLRLLRELRWQKVALLLHKAEGGRRWVLRVPVDINRSEIESLEAITPSDRKGPTSRPSEREPGDSRR